MVGCNLLEKSGLGFCVLGLNQAAHMACAIYIYCLLKFLCGFLGVVGLVF